MLVPGACIGSSVARALAAAGARVLIGYNEGRDAAEALASELRAAGGQVKVLQADLARSDGPAELIERVSGVTSALDSLVVNAGVAPMQDILSIDVATFDHNFGVNARAAFFTVQQATPLLRERWSVVFISSLAASTNIPGLEVYNACKAAITPMLRGYAAALVARGRAASAR